MPDRVPDGPSRAGWPGAGHGGGDDRRVPYGPMPDRVRYGPSPTHVSSCPSPSVPVVVTVGHVARPSSAMPRPNIRLSPTPPTAVYERLFFYMAVAFHECPFGGAAKARRWAALNP